MYGEFGDTTEVTTTMAAEVTASAALAAEMATLATEAAAAPEETGGTPAVPTGGDTAALAVLTGGDTAAPAGDMLSRALSQLWLNYLIL